MDVMPQSRLGYLGFGKSKAEAVAAIKAAASEWAQIQSAFESANVYPYFDAKYLVFVNEQVAALEAMYKQAVDAWQGVTFWGNFVDQANGSVTVAQAVRQQIAALEKAKAEGRPPSKGSIKPPTITGMEGFFLSPGAAVAVLLAGVAVFAIASYKGVKAWRITKG
jgi:hypothetical protein